MIASIVVTGVLGDVYNKRYRTISVERPYRKNDNSRIIDKFLAIHWTKSDSNIFLKVPSNTPISIEGRLEIDDEVGTVIVAQEIEILSKNLELIDIEGD